MSTPYSTVFAVGSPGSIYFGPRLEETIRTDSVDVAISADGRRVAAITKDGRVCVWETDSKRCSHELRLPNPDLNLLHFSPDGKFLAIHCNDRIEQENMVAAFDGLCVANLEEHKIYSTGDAKSVSLSVFDHGNRVIYTEKENIVCRDAKTLELVWSKTRDINQTRFSSIAIHPTENRLALATLGGQLQILKTDDGSVLETHRIGLTIIGIAWNAEEERLFVRARGVGLAILDSITFRILATIPKEVMGNAGTWLSFTDGGKQLAYCRVPGCPGLRLPRKTSLAMGQKH